MRRLRSLVVVVAAFTTACERPTGPTVLVYDDRPVIVPPASRGWSSVSVGGSHTCGIRLDGSLYCWGSNGSSQLGVGTARGTCGASRTPCEGGPRAAATALRFTSVSAGARHGCAIATSGALYCWGESLHFQTGIQALAFVPVPTEVLPGLQFISVGAGLSHTCAVRTNGVVYCWGDGTLGALGRGDTTSSVLPAPIQSTEKFALVRTGQTASCAIALNGALWCWGAEWESASGGLDFYHARVTPHRIDGLPPVRDVSVGVLSICAIAMSGDAYCWEANGFGQLGTGNLTPSATPVPVAGQQHFSGVSVGIIQTCAVADGGRAMCWGNNSFGQLGVPRPGEHCGDAGLECSRTPISVFGQQQFSQVATGIGNHVCGVSLDTSILCWGLGSDGQLGDGFTRDRQSLPVGVLAPSP